MTTEQKHTPGPWIAEGSTVLLNNRTDYRELIATTAKMLNPVANAARIVACVNACDGLERPEEQVPDMANTVQDYMTTVDRLRDTNAELLAALKDISSQLAEHPDAQRGNAKVHYCVEKARAAIAKATGDENA